MARSTRRRVRTQDEGHRTGRALNVPGQEPPVRSPAPTRSSSSTPKEESSSPVRRTPYEEWMNRDRDTSELDRYMTRGRLDKLPPINPNVQTPSLQLHNSPLMQLLVDFGVMDSPFSPFTPSGIDKPLLPLEMISEAAPLGEYYVPQTVRDLLMGGTGGILGTGAANTAMTGRRILGAGKGSGFQPVYGSRVMDKVAEHMPTDTLGRLADDADTSFLGRLMRYFYPNKSITDPKYVPSSSRSTRRTGVTEQVDNLTPEQEIGFESRPNVPVHFRTHKADIPEGIAGSLDAELDLAKSQAKKLRAEGASPQQRAFGRRLLRDVRTERGVPGSGAFPRDVLMHGDNAPDHGMPFMEWLRRLQRRGDVPVSLSRPSRPQRRPHDPIERNLTQSDRSFLRSLGIDDSGF